MKITLSLSPRLHISGDRVATEEYFRKCHAAFHRKEKLPNTRWALEEWEDFDEKNSSFFKDAVNLFTAEVQQIYLAFLSVGEVSASKIEAWRLFDQVLQGNHFQGNFAGHPIMGELTPGTPAVERPGTTRFDLLHPMPNSETNRCPMYLEKIEVSAFAPPGADLSNLRGADLPIKALIREGIPSYLHAAISGVHDQKWKWKEIQQPLSLSEDKVELG